jgi:hypothetical protein
LPQIFFGDAPKIALVNNPKAGCTMAKNFLFRMEHGYYYLNFPAIHASRNALRSIRWPVPKAAKSGLLAMFGSAPGHPSYRVYADYNPELFAFVRNPLDRFISGFISKIVRRGDKNYSGLRDTLTCHHGVDLGVTADYKRSILKYADWLEKQDMKLVDPHFRAQHFNLGQHLGLAIPNIVSLGNKPAVSEFIGRHIGKEGAAEFLSQKFNDTSETYPKDMFMSDELKARVKQIFAHDYRTYFPELL